MNTGVHAAKASKRARASAWLRGDGIEIGALHNPLELPPGASVRYVDRMTEGELREHYPELATLDLTPVSIIGDAHDLSQLGDATVDFVVANHLIEHLEDPIGGLAEMHRVLRPGGILYIALPDPRATYDRNRPLTTVDHVLEEHRAGTGSTRRGHFEEWVDLVEPLLTDWHHVLTGRDLDREGQVRALMDIDYSIHFHVWRPETFLDLLSAARRELGLRHEMVAFEPCVAGSDDEFIIVLRTGEFESPPPPRPEPAVVNVAPTETVPAPPVSTPVRRGILRRVGGRLRALSR